MKSQDLKLDYFKFYEVVRNCRVDDRVALHGQFDMEPEKAELLLRAYFANPVSKNREEIYDRNAHLVWYSLHQQIPEPTRIIVAENQFGKHNFLIGHPIALLVPAWKYEQGSEFPKELDHYKVYRVLEGEPINEEVTLKDQFGGENVKVFFPVAFAVPVIKKHEGNTYPILNEKAHLLIYNIKPRPAQQARIIRDQFDKYYLNIFRSRFLAAPSVKLEWREI